MHVRGCNWNQKLINSSVAAILFSTVIQMDHIIKELVCHGTCKKEEENQAQYQNSMLEKGFITSLQLKLTDICCCCLLLFVVVCC